MLSSVLPEMPEPAGVLHAEHVQDCPECLRETSLREIPMAFSQSFYSSLGFLSSWQQQHDGCVTEVKVV